jgi:secreted trypsin-like serine protease
LTRRLCVIVATAVALGVGGGALAVIGGSVDTTHTYVGAFLQPQVHNGQAGTELCTGFLIGPTALVTAAHCYDPAGGPVRVTFATSLAGAQFTMASFDAAQDDVAVFTLQSAQPSWPALPAVDASASADAVDIVGYGVEGLTPEKTPTAFGTREIVTTPVKSSGNLADQFLKLLASPGACFGDSGGPNFISGTSTIVAITLGGSKNCNGVSYAERIDTPVMLAFLAPFANP